MTNGIESQDMISEKLRKLLPNDYVSIGIVNNERFLNAKNRILGGMARIPDTDDDNEYTFAQLADPQFGMLPQILPALYLVRIQRFISIVTLGFLNGKSWLPVPELMVENRGLSADQLFMLEVEFSRSAVDAINALRPKPNFAVVCGDLVHSYPDKDLKLNKAQVQVFKEIFSRVDPDIFLICTCGNHDVSERPTPALLELWKSRFGDDYFSFWVGNDKFIVINSQLYKDSSRAKAHAAAQDRWLDKELSLDEGSKNGNKKRRQCIVFSHVPPFIDSPEEPNGYFPLSKKVRLDLLQRMSQAGVTHWFCGHFHRNAGGMYKQLEVVTTAAVGGNIITDPKTQKNDLSGIEGIVGKRELSGIRICKVTKKGTTHRFHSLKELLEAPRQET